MMSTAPAVSLRPLIRGPRLSARIRQLGASISRHYAGQPLTIVVLLDGAMPFAADLLRCIHHPDLQVRTLRASSYGSGTVSSGEVVLGDMPPSTANRC